MTEGTTLRERLRQQIRRRKDDERVGKASSSEMSLLRLVAVASEYEGRLRTRSLVERLGVPAADLVIDSMEREYLLRSTDGGEYLEGLHPVRSTILVDLLIDPGTPWGEAAETCLFLLDPRDIGSFLLYAARRHTEDVGSVLAALDGFHPDNWVAFAGVTRALLWLGIQEYVEANEGLIGEAISDSGGGWWVILDTDLADAMPGVADSVLDMFAQIGASPERLARIVELRERQRPKSEAFAWLRSWLAAQNLSPSVPVSIDEWKGASEVLFWAGRLGVEWPMTEWLSTEALDRAAPELPLPIVADLIAGLWEVAAGYAAEWLAANRDLLGNRFRRETQSPVLLDSEGRLTAYFIVPPWLERAWNAESPHVKDTDNAAHNEALIRIDLLRRLFPDRNAYACQGHGHLVPILGLTHDDTRKTGISHEKLPLRWGPQANAILNGLVALPQRPNDWHEYVRNVVILREQTVAFFEELCRATETYLASPVPLQVLGASLLPASLATLWRLSREVPPLPRCAVDEWGYINEHQTGAAISAIHAGGPRPLQRIPSLQPWRPLLKPLNSYASAVNRFLMGAAAVMRANETVVKTVSSDFMPSTNADEEQTDPRIRGTVQALADLRSAARALQAPFRELLGDLIAPYELTALMRREEEIFFRAWTLWRIYAERPDQVLYRPARVAHAEWDDMHEQLTKNLRHELEALAIDELQASICADGLLWEDESALWLTVNGQDAFTVYTSRTDILDAVIRAIMAVKDTALRRHVLDDRWSHIIVIPLLRGGSLAGRAWRVHTGVLLGAGSSDALERFHNISLPIPSAALDQLGIRIWDDSRLVSGVEIAMAGEELLALSAHFADLSGMPQPDTLAREIMETHLKRGSIWVEESIWRISDGLAQLAKISELLLPARADEVHGLGAVIDELRDTLDELRAFVQANALNTATAESWADALQTTFLSAGTLQLEVATQVLATQ